MTRPESAAPPSHYPVALVPGQFQEYYRKFSAAELLYDKINAFLSATLLLTLRLFLSGAIPSTLPSPTPSNWTYGYANIQEEDMTATARMTAAIAQNATAVTAVTALIVLT